MDVDMMPNAMILKMPVDDIELGIIIAYDHKDLKIMSSATTFISKLLLKRFLFGVLKLR